MSEVKFKNVKIKATSHELLMRRAIDEANEKGISASLPNYLMVASSAYEDSKKKGKV